MFPSNSPFTRRPLPSTGSLRLPFPGFLGTIRRCDSRPPIPPRFALLRLAVPDRAPVFAPQGPTPTSKPGTLRLGSPTPTWVRKRPGLPGSWRTLPCLCPALRPRQDRTHQALRCAGAAPAKWKTKAPTTSAISGLNHTASALAVYASDTPVARRSRKTRFPLSARLYGTGLDTRRVRTKGFRDASYITSSFPRLCLAQPKWQLKIAASAPGDLGDLPCSHRPADS